MNTVDANTLPSGALALETHSGRRWAAVLLIVMAVPLFAVSVAGAPVWPLVLIAILGAGVTVMAWSGFQYRFLRDGLEIRLLGFRLRSIPKSTILSYSIEPWSLMRGYGIRGIGRTRAYVWCNKVVHIRTSTGDIYLGHNDPDRIVRDLDQMMGVVSRG